MRIQTVLLSLCFMFFGVPVTVSAQVRNTSQETFDYQPLADGQMAVGVTLDDREALFVLTLSGRTVLFKDANTPGNTADGATHTLSLDKSLYAEKQPFPVTDAPVSLRNSDVKGLQGIDMLHNVVLTIDAKHHKITVSSPYRPPFIKLSNRVRLAGTPTDQLRLPVTVNQHALQLPLLLDQPATLSLTESQRQQLDVVDDCSLGIAHSEWTTRVDQPARLPESFLGNGILQHGLLSVDFPKSSIYFQPFDEAPITYQQVSTPSTVVVEGKPTEIGRSYFLEHIWDYTADVSDRHRNDVPCVIDFWATWCIPCKRLSPLIDELAKKYQGKIKFFKVNYDQERKLADDLGIGALPTLFVVPTKGEPKTLVGPKHEELEAKLMEMLQ